MYLYSQGLYNLIREYDHNSIRNTKHDISDIIQQTVAKGTFNLLSFMYQQMLMIGIGSGQYLVTVLASIGGNVLKMFVFNMVLESSQTAASLDQTTLCALI